MFNFRIIILSDSTEIVDMTLKTPYESLTVSQMEKYIEWSNKICFMDRMKREESRQRKIKISGNLFKKLASICGLL